MKRPDSGMSVAPADGASADARGADASGRGPAASGRDASSPPSVGGAGS
jgi:hypothetical protein